MTCSDYTTQDYFQMSAPYPAIQTTIVLKNPEVGDAESILDSVTVSRAVDGTLYSYIKTKNGRRKLKWDFTLSRNKCIELEDFLYSYFASQIYVVDMNGRKWIGNFTSNPFDFTGKERAGPALQGWPTGENYSFSVEFQASEVL